MLDLSTKFMLGYEMDDSDFDIVEDFAMRQSEFGKPCHMTGYCPYGGLVMEEPLLGLALTAGHFDYDQLEDITHALADGEWADEQSAWAEGYVLGQWKAPESAEGAEVPASISGACCSVTGRLCPSFKHAERWVDSGHPVDFEFGIGTCDGCGKPMFVCYGSTPRSTTKSKETSGGQAGLRVVVDNESR